MQSVEGRNIMFELLGGNAPSAEECYRRQKRQGKEYDEQRAALRRVLHRILPTDTTPPDTKTMEKQLRPAAKEAMEKALKEAVKDLNK